LGSKKQDISPPAFPLKLLKWLCKPKYHSDIEGDLLELYHRRVVRVGQRRAGFLLFKDVILLLRPGIVRPIEGYKNLNTYGMYKSYFKIGWRNLLKNKGYSFINIGGLALGMAVAMLIGLWMHDELIFDSCHPNHDRIAQVMLHEFSNNEIKTGVSNPAVLAEELRNAYGGDFKYVVHSIWTDSYTLGIQITRDRIVFDCNTRGPLLPHPNNFKILLSQGKLNWSPLFVFCGICGNDRCNIIIV
jgi:hypothetical protein